MRVQVRLFAAARDLVGAGQTEIDLPVGATVQVLADQLFELYPGLSAMRLRFAVNAVYARSDIVLNDGDEIALIPPVGGG